MNHPTPTQMIDKAGNTHTLEITSDGSMLDGKPCQINVKETQIMLMSADPTRGIITLAPAAFWHAFAGSDPTPEAAGLLLAEMVARHEAMQEIAELVWRVRPLLDEIERHTQEHRTLPLPPYRFPPFVSQLLATLDGTREQTLAVARILKQAPATIEEWAVQAGTRLPLPQPCSLLTCQEQGTTTTPERTDEPRVERLSSGDLGTAQHAPNEAADARSRKRGYLWTEAHQRLLEEAVQMSQQVSTNAKIKEIAARFDWPLHVVDYRMRQLLTKRQHQQHKPEEHALQEERVEPLPITSPLADEKQSSSPLLLPAGAFLWDVKIAGILQRWPLDIVYGTFPCAAGSHVVYRDKVYALQQVWHSIIEVASVVNAHSPTVMELVEV